MYTQKRRPVSDHDLLALLSELIAIDSCDPPGRELEIADYLAGVLGDRGIEAEVDEFAPGRANLYARLKGSDIRGSLVFSAHLDTVPVGTTGWQRKPFEADIDTGRLYGRGASDMKGGVAAMTLAFISIASSKTPLSGDLVLAFSGGESSNCIGAKRFVERKMFAEASAILVSEPSSLDLVIAEMAALWLRVSAKGRTGHISGNRGISAIDKMLDYVRDLESLEIPFDADPMLPLPSLRVGRIAGGSAVNVTPDQCSVELDIRLRPGTDYRAVIALLERDGFTVEVLDFKKAVATDVSHPFVKTCATTLNNIMGHHPKYIGVSYYSDATIYTSAWNTPFAIIGPGELGMSGQPDEFIVIDKLVQSVDVFRAIAENWLRTPEGFTR